MRCRYCSCGINEVMKFRNIMIILALIMSCVLILGCGDDKAEQLKAERLQEIQQLIDEKEFEAARIAAIDTLEPSIRALYHQADDNLGHASHLDVSCNERIEEILYDLVKEVPQKHIEVNRDIYSELLNLYPRNKLYEKKFIFYDRKLRRMASN